MISTTTWSTSHQYTSISQPVEWTAAVEFTIRLAKANANGLRDPTRSNTESGESRDEPGPPRKRPVRLPEAVSGGTSGAFCMGMTKIWVGTVTCPEVARHTFLYWK